MRDPPYEPPTAASLHVPPAYAGAAPQPAEDLAQWWSRFEDPTLTDLIALALADNQDIAQSVARVAQAREAGIQARAALLPSLSATADLQRSHNDGQSGAFAVATNTAIGDESLSASWTLDVFGGGRRALQAARADWRAAGLTLANVQIGVEAAVAQAYVDVRAYGWRIAIARQTLKTEDEDLQIARWRAQAGLVSALDVAQARSQRDDTAAAIPPLAKAEGSARRRLATLTGSPPAEVDRRLDDGRGLPEAGPLLGVGVPADLLRRRPDVRSAEQSLAAASARVGVARAALYPSFTLSGSFGGQSTLSPDLGTVATSTVLASVSQTIFDGGRLRSIVRQRRAGLGEAKAAYRASLLTAVEDVETALIAQAQGQARAQDLATEVEAADLAATLARGRYRSGLTDYQTLLQTERTLLQARDGLVEARADQSRALIQLYLALGGGWGAASAAPATASGR